MAQAQLPVRAVDCLIDMITQIVGWSSVNSVGAGYGMGHGLHYLFAGSINVVVKRTILKHRMVLKIFSID
tara:strand:- start:240 stop:449 length:210 start_codon:yes stop_codon:yes gene_type:complete